MRKISILLSLILAVSTEGFAQTKKAKPTVTNKRPVVQRPAATTAGSQINFAISQMKGGQYLSASNTLLALSRRNDMKEQKPQIKYLLGLAFMELDLNQVAAFQFVDVIRSGQSKYSRSALEKLLIVTDKLGDETLLNYALQRIDVNNLPAQHKDILYYRLGEIKQKAKQYADANAMYANVSPSSRFYLNALYNMGLSQAEAGQVDLALSTFKKLYNTRKSAGVLDTNRVAALMGLARSFYQKQEWTKAIEMYSMIPRDHFMWHDALFEQSWSMLRAGRFRSALSNFQSLHSSYYDDFYIPESLLLRSIVYLYICKYDEMEKVLSLFEKQYGPVQRGVDSFLKNRSALSYYVEVEKAYMDKFKDGPKTKTRLPYVSAKYISNQGDVRRSLQYIQKISAEKKRIDEDSRIRTSPVGSYSSRLLISRIKSAKERTGDLVKAHLQNMSIELKDLNDQAGLIRYEMINGQKETLKKRLADKDVNEKGSEEEKTRSFYAENGYEYYPFQGEFWLDEIGNYHYLGKQSCE